MDTLNVWRSLWRNRWLVLPVVILTVLASCWVLYIRPPSYQAQSSLLIVPPPPAPTPDDIAKNPKLGQLNTDNPYGRNYDPTILIALVSISLTSDAGREAIKKAGGDERFTVAQSSRYGFSTPFADIASIGGSAQQAITSNELVIEAFTRELARLQLKENVSSAYLITARVAGEPSSARIQVTDIGTTLLLVIGLGVIGLFCVVSLGDSVREIRRQQAAKAPTKGAATQPSTALPMPFRGGDSVQNLTPPPQAVPRARMEQVGTDFPSTGMRPQ